MQARDHRPVSGSETRRNTIHDPFQLRSEGWYQRGKLLLFTHYDGAVVYLAILPQLTAVLVYGTSLRNLAVHTTRRVDFKVVSDEPVTLSDI